MQGMEQRYNIFEIAKQQLETALRLFDEGIDYFSVITLAGASEEILGKELERRQKSNSMSELKSAVVAMAVALDGAAVEEKWVADKANYARNALKHHSRDEFVQLDARQEAVEMLHRAIDNYWHLNSNLTERMQKFQTQ